MAKSRKKAGKSATNDAKPVKRRRKLTAARVRKLALNHDDMTGADASLGSQWNLPGLLNEFADLHAAWRRGRLLRDLRRLASVGATRHEAAHDLNIDLPSFERLVSEDIEAAEIWNTGKLETAIRVKESLLANAEAGKAQAIKQLENVLRSEIAHAAFNVQRVPESIVTEIFGVTRMTLNTWHREKGCPRNGGETTYDLPAMIAWFEQWTRAKAGIVPADKGPSALEQQRLLDLQVRKRELVAKDAVEAGWSLRARALVSILERMPEQLAPMAAGKTKEQLRPMLQNLADDIRREYVAAVDQVTQRSQ